MITHVNNNDGTIEGLRHRREPAFSVQYHPEASPGPYDSSYLFDDFLAMVRQFHQDRAKVARQTELELISRGG
jgi:carbamoyl-phosphate synthase small subunit